MFPRFCLVAFGTEWAESCLYEHLMLYGLIFGSSVIGIYYDYTAERLYQSLNILREVYARSKEYRAVAYTTSIRVHQTGKELFALADVTIQIDGWNEFNGTTHIDAQPTKFILVSIWSMEIISCIVYDAVMCQVSIRILPYGQCRRQLLHYLINNECLSIRKAESHIALEVSITKGSTQGIGRYPL